MKRIGLFISAIEQGGAERAITRLSYILKDEYEIVFIVCEDTFHAYEFYGELINLNIKSDNRFFGKIFNIFRRTKALKKVKKKLKLHCVISFLDSPNLINVLSKTRDCKTIVSIRNYSFKENSSTLIGRITQKAISLLYKKADLIIAVSRLINEAYCETYKFNSSKVKTIYNAYNLDEIVKLSDVNVALPQIGNKKYFVSVGRISYQKGFWHLIKAFHLLSKENDNYGLIIVGKDDSNGKLHNFVMQNNIKNVLLVGSQTNPFVFLKQSFCFVSSSLYEGFPNALVEAMCCSLPIISSNCKSGPYEILADKHESYATINDISLEKYGILVPELETEENYDIDVITEGELMLAKAMKKLMNNDDLMNYYSKMSYERSKCFGYERCKEQYINIIEDTCDGI